MNSIAYSSPGVEIRVNRLRALRRPYILALDDGVYEAPRAPLLKRERFQRAILDSQYRPPCYLLTAGLARSFLSGEPALGRVVLLTLSSPDDVAAKRPVHTVQYAVASGADALASHISTSCSNESPTVSNASALIAESHGFGFPVLLSAYARKDDATIADRIRAVRIAVELGADLIKTDYPESRSNLAKLVEVADDRCLMIAGGQPSSDVETKRMVDDICALPETVGLCFGRRLLYASDPSEIMRYVYESFAHGARS